MRMLGNVYYARLNYDLAMCTVRKRMGVQSIENEKER